MIVGSDQIDDESLSVLTIYPSLYAYCAYTTSYDETPIDELVQLYHRQRCLQGL
jgi:hypothetical protein